MSNSAHDSRTRIPYQEIRWRVIVLTYLAAFFGSFAFGMALHLVSFCINWIVGGDLNFKEFLTNQTVKAAIVRGLISLVPVAAGAFFLAIYIKSSIWQHVSIFSILYLASTLLTAMTLLDDGFSTELIAYYLCIVPTAVVGAFIGSGAR